MKVGVVSLFPEMFSSLTAFGITGKALRAGVWSFNTFNPRSFAKPPYYAVDDKVYGGGPGVVLKAEPVALALEAAKTELPSASVVYLGPEGTPLTQGVVKTLAAKPEIILLAGRYEGIDERILFKKVDIRISLGDYILSGGELPAMILLDAMIRLLPGALGHAASCHDESFSEGLLEAPQFTRPPVFEGLKVPKVLQEGNHKAIETWKRRAAILRTYKRRPDLLQSYPFSEPDRIWFATLDPNAPIEGANYEPDYS